MLRVIGQDDPSTEPVLSAQLTAEIKNETTFSHITGVCWRIKRSSAGAINLA